MLFATIDATSTLIVGAADDAVELDRFYAKVDATPKADRLFSEEYQPSVSDMLLDDRFHKFKKPPFVFEFADSISQEKFIAHYQITVMSLPALLERQHMMLQKLLEDEYFTSTKTIEEALGLEDNDPWDYRTAEEKAADEANKKEAEANKKAGKLSGDSFGPSTKRAKKTKDGAARVTDIRTSTNEDGSVEIDDVLAVKGLHDDNGKGAWLPKDEQPITPTDASATVADAQPGEHFYRFTDPAGFGDKLDAWLDLLGILADTAKMAARDKLVVQETSTSFTLRGDYFAHRLAFYLQTVSPLVKIQTVDVDFKVVRKKFVPDVALAQQIDPQGWVAIFHRVDVVGWDLPDVLDAIRREGIVQGKDLLVSNVGARGYIPGVSWLACPTKLAAETIEGILRQDPAFAGAAIEVYGVNDKGERLVPKGVEIVEEVEEAEPPRPWNDRAAEWDAMDEAAKKAIKIKGEEFLFCGNYRGASDGCIVYITPRKYFAEHGEMWEGTLPIKLADDLKRRAPGIYQTKSRDWINLCNDLTARGMTESLGLQLYINAL